jgi:hypothetical protein
MANFMQSVALALALYGLASAIMVYVYVGKGSLAQGLAMMVLAPFIAIAAPFVLAAMTPWLIQKVYEQFLVSNQP